jgi:predicted metal-binding membrane protein
VSDRQATAAATAARALDPQTLRVGLVAALSAVAWLALAAWSLSPYGRYLEHGGWADEGPFGALCRSIPQGALIVPALVYALVWLLMITAMMLPTTLPLLAIFRRIVAARSDGAALVATLLAGYAAAWLGFGVVAYGIDVGVREAATSGWLLAHGWVVGAVVIGVAGAFQFSALKYRCLERCRSPFGFVNARWRSRRPLAESLQLGIAHGLFCVGCCWALMLVTFVVGMGNVGWMLIVAAAMAAEKNLRWGARLRTPFGAALLLWAAGIVVANA